MFDCDFSNVVQLVRIVALTGKKGQPPILWEGPISTDISTIERSISRNRRIVEWLYSNHFVNQRTATVDLQLQGYANGKRIESHTIRRYSFIVRGRRRAKSVADEVVLRSFDMVEHVLDLMKSLIDERDTVVGRVAAVGLKSLSAPPQSAPPPQSADAMSSLLTKLPELISLAQSFKSMRKGSKDEN